MKTSQWHVALTAQFGDRPIEPDHCAAAQLAALRSRVLLVFSDGSCFARYQVDATDMSLALRSAMGRWAHVTETAQLPWWEISHLEADLISHDSDKLRTGPNDTDGHTRVSADQTIGPDSDDRTLRIVR